MMIEISIKPDKYTTPELFTISTDNFLFAERNDTTDYVGGHTPLIGKPTPSSPVYYYDLVLHFIGGTVKLCRFKDLDLRDIEYNKIKEFTK